MDKRKETNEIGGVYEKNKKTSIYYDGGNLT